MKKPNVVSKTTIDIASKTQHTHLYVNDYTRLYNRLFETLDVVIKYDSSIVKSVRFIPSLHNAQYKITNNLVKGDIQIMFFNNNVNRILPNTDLGFLFLRIARFT